jgi:cardiolipin synthase
MFHRIRDAGRKFYVQNRLWARKGLGKSTVQTRMTDFQARIRSNLASRVLLNPDVMGKLGGPLSMRHQIAARWHQTLEQLLPLGGTSEGNSVTVFHDGDEAFRAMWRAILTAKKTILMETYIFNPDQVGERTLLALKAAAKRGVKITLIYDSMGSYKLYFTSDYLAQLSKLGVKIVPFNCLFRHSFSGRSVLFRNHRKILVVDDSVGFCGGMNISDEYCGVKEGGTGEFRDTHSRVIGPAVLDLKKVFEDSIREAVPDIAAVAHASDSTAHSSKQMTVVSRQRFRTNSFVATHSKTLSPIRPSEEQNTYHNVFLQVLASNVFRNVLSIQRSLTLTLAAARKNVCITNPYFFPPKQLMRSIASAASRGVDVKILLAGDGVSDVSFARWASSHMMHYLLQRDVKIYELRSRVLHCKTVSIDGLYSSIGSFNLDLISNRRNLEVCLTMVDPAAARNIEEQFARDLLESEEITLESLGKRTLLLKLRDWVSYYVLRFGSSELADRMLQRIYKIMKYINK